MKRRLLAVTMAVMVAAVAGCGADEESSSTGASSPTDPTKVTGAITVLTNRTDLVSDGTWQKYSDEFRKVYPNVQVKFEGMTDYEGEVKIRMNTENYGDVLLIPNNVAQGDYPNFFASLGSEAELREKYLFTSKGAVSGEVYGLASFAATNGFLYNKDVWKQAGITEWPTTPEEFLAGLTAIKSKTSAIPYYTNYKDGWPLTSWTNAVGEVSCDPKANDNLAATDNPWAPGSDLNVADSLLYNIVNQKLSEPDPTTTNWENSKNLIATGKVGTMWLGSWAIAQMQDAAKKAGKDPASIGFMPFPAQPGGTFCAVKAPDYLFAVNKHSKAKEAARAWIDWLLDKSGFAENNQAISSVQGAPLPVALKPFEEKGVRFIELSQAQTALVNKIDKASEVGLTSPDYRQQLIDVARGSVKGDLNSVFADLAKKWATGRQDAGA